MKLRYILVAVLCTLSTFAGPGVRRCATTQHMKELNDKKAALNPGANHVVSIIPEMPRPNSIYYIPVVVHVLWNTSGQNISDAQIQSQIDVLNEDYARLNANASGTPAAFSSIASSTNFRFCMARLDPNGNATTGIERRQTTKTEFQTDDDMKHFGQGGLDQWDPDKYLNIWVCNLADDILGYAETPDNQHTNTYGVVIAFNAFGRTGTATSPYHLGRTTTHEIGHCFDLWHIWGDDNGSCGGFGDRVYDTPDQTRETFNCSNFPLLDSCSPAYPGVMFMNYMDYSDDACMNMFTAGQANRMYTRLNSFYPNLLTSTSCNNVGMEQISTDFLFSLYPNPSNGTFYVDLSASEYIGAEINVVVTNTLGEIIIQQNITNPVGRIHELNLGDKSKGVYFVTLANENYKMSKRIVLE